MGYIKQNKLKLLLSVSLIFSFTALNIIILKQALTLNASNQVILSKLSDTNQIKYPNPLQLISNTISNSSTTSVNLNGATTDLSSDRPINQMLKSELVALIQNTIQDELHSSEYMANSTSNSYLPNKRKPDASNASPLLNASINSNFSSEFDEDTSIIAEDEIAIVIESAIGHGVWSTEDNEQLMGASLRLKPEAKRRIRERLMTAINNQELRMTKDALITF